MRIDDVKHPHHRVGQSSVLGLRRPLNFVRLYAITSVLVLVVFTAVVLVYRDIEVQQLISLSQQHNEQLAKPMANIVWPQFAEYIASATGMDTSALKTSPESREIRGVLRQLATGISTLKIKIYNEDGVTVFSTEADEIGENQERNPAFRAALSTFSPVSTLTRANTEGEFERKIQHRHVVESYIPYVFGHGLPVGVFELYTDVTPFLSGIERSADFLITGFLVVFGVVFASVFVVVWRADRVIAGQYEDINQQHEDLIREVAERKVAEAALKEARDELERRVNERTRRLVEEMAERKKTERQLLRHQNEWARVSTAVGLGEMATTLAHEINQPLSVISGWTQLCIKLSREAFRGDDEQGGKVLTYLTNVAGEAERATQVVSRIRRYLHQGEQPRKRIDINAAIDGVAALLRFEAAEAETVMTFEFGGDLPLVFADPIQIQQVVINLAHNAIESMSGMPASARRLRIRTSRPEHGIIQVAVCDQGPGLADDVRERVFDPFFSTKKEGLGMGLAICRTIIEAHGGHLRGHGRPEGGSVFSFTLPEGEKRGLLSA